MKSIKIKLDDGKYEVVIFPNGEMRATRNGEECRDLTGDNLILFMAMRIEELENTIKAAKDCLISAAIDVINNACEILGGDYKTGNDINKILSEKSKQLNTPIIMAVQKEGE